MSNGPTTFETLILPLYGSDPNERPAPHKPGPLPALFHRAPGAGKRLLIYVPGGIAGSILTGRHEYGCLARALDRIGCSTLLLQMTSAQRTAYELFDTCANDIRTGVEWAKANGFSEVAVTGLSMGGPRVAFWNATYPDPAVKTLVFLATIESSYLASARNWTPEQQTEQDLILQHCRELIAAGKPREIIQGKLLSMPLMMSAEAYLSYLGTIEEMNASTIKWADKITIPAAVVHSVEDFAAPPEGAQAIHDSLVNAPRRSITYIQNGDHQLLTSGQMADDTTSAIASWVDSVLAP